MRPMARIGMGEATGLLAGGRPAGEAVRVFVVLRGCWSGLAPNDESPALAGLLCL